VVFYWPDTEESVEFFELVGTQWRTGVNGCIGLDYPAIYPLMERLKLSEEHWARLFCDLRILEDEALAAMHEKNE